MKRYQLFRGGISRFPYLGYCQARAVIRGAEGGFKYAQAYAMPALARRRRLKTFPL